MLHRAGLHLTEKRIGDVNRGSHKRTFTSKKCPNVNVQNDDDGDEFPLSSKLRQSTFGDAEFFKGLHPVDEIEGICFAGKQVLIGADGLRGVIGLV